MNSRARRARVEDDRVEVVPGIEHVTGRRWWRRRCLVAAKRNVNDESGKGQQGNEPRSRVNAPRAALDADAGRAQQRRNEPLVLVFAHRVWNAIDSRYLCFFSLGCKTTIISTLGSKATKTKAQKEKHTHTAKD